MANILVTDGMADDGIHMLVEAGHEVDQRKVGPEELLDIIGNYDALVVRSATQVTAKVLKAGAPNLKLVGRAGVGVDNIDCPTATQLGIIVMNAPLGNILSAAEHTIGMIFAAARNIPQAHALLSNGTWDKKRFIGVELHGKTLGIIGLGKIGKHVANVLHAAGMRIIAYDPFLSQEIAEQLRIESVSLEQLYAQADVITLHTPLNDKTRNLLNAESLAKLKKGVRIVNVARGGIIDEDALATALQSGQVAAAALDVFAEEPIATDSPLFACASCIRTPHLGASTAEAQVRVSTDIASGFIDFFASGKINNSVNVQLRVDPAIDSYLLAAEKLGKALAQTTELPLRALEVRSRGELATYDTKPLAVAALKGALSHICDSPVNLVNAQIIAEDRGITLSTSSTLQLRDNQARLAVKANTREGDHSIAGSVIDGELRILRFDDYVVDLPLGGHLLIMEYPDRPGMVGQYGSILGQAHINIARMEVSRIDGRGDALVVLTLDDPVPPEVMKELKDTVKPRQAFTVSF